MHFLADENVPRVAVEALRAAGVEVACVRTDAPGSPMRRILARVVAEQRALPPSGRTSASSCSGVAPPNCGVVLFRITCA